MRYASYVTRLPEQSVKRNSIAYGRELGLSELVDRADELGVIEATIRNRAKLFLIGPRRYGKTSLLSAAGEAAERSGALVIRVDAEKYESLNLLAAALLTATTRALQGNQKKALKAVIMTEGRQPLSGEVTRALRIPASSLQTALTALQKAHLVRTEAARGETRYRLVDPFFADWLRVSQG